mgnify:CR=1 FL=1
MKAMILAAGRGERMRPLTDDCPKPLLTAGGHPLIVHHLQRLRAAGIVEIVINHAHLGHLIEAALGNGARFGVRISYSAERVALETAGGIRKALPRLGTGPFMVINGDVFCDADLGAFAATPLAAGDLAHLLMVPNPAHHPDGDFALEGDRLIDTHETGTPRLTFSGIGVYRPELFSELPEGESRPLAPLLREAMRTGRARGALHAGRWFDIGTPERLAQLDALLHAERTL